MEEERQGENSRHTDQSDDEGTEVLAGIGRHLLFVEQEEFEDASLLGI
jgi:hypothetical protein